eukprot:scaffold321349_cov30-Tisochrysis_lutea.AAC.2
MWHKLAFLTFRLGKFFRHHEHVAHEEGVVGEGTDNADADAVARVPARVSVDHINPVLGVEVVDGSLSVDHVRLLRQLDVDSPPPDVVDRSRLLDDALVLGRAARLGSRADHQSARVRQV